MVLLYVKYDGSGIADFGEHDGIFCVDCSVANEPAGVSYEAT